MNTFYRILLGSLILAASHGCSGRGAHDANAQQRALPSEDSYFNTLEVEFLNLGAISRLSTFPHSGTEWHTETTQLEANEPLVAVGKYFSESAVLYIVAISEDRHLEFSGLLWDRQELRFTQVIPLQYDYRDEDKHAELLSTIQLGAKGKLPNIIQMELEDAEIVGQDSTGYSSSGTKTFWRFDGTTYVASPFEG